MSQGFSIKNIECLVTTIFLINFSTVRPGNAKLSTLHEPGDAGREVAAVASRPGRGHIVGDGDHPLQHSKHEGARNELQERARASTPQTTSHHLRPHVLSKVGICKVDYQKVGREEIRDCFCKKMDNSWICTRFQTIISEVSEANFEAIISVRIKGIFFAIPGKSRQSIFGQRAAYDEKIEAR